MSCLRALDVKGSLCLGPITAIEFVASWSPSFLSTPPILFGPMSTLKILHFNDVYRVTKQKVPGGTIDVSQFAAMLEKERSRWADLPNGKKEGLLLFSGDVFSPSVESSVTRGSHMVRS